MARLTRQVVLFLDILGSTLMASNLHAQRDLGKLSEALKFAHELALLKQAGTPYQISSFTDNVVLGWLIKTGNALELLLTLKEAAAYQYALTRHGFFVRGGLTCGRHYMDNDMVFGPALIEAVELERASAIYPRIVLGGAATNILRRVRKGGVVTGIGKAVARSDDGHVFVNYLTVLLSDRSVAPRELLKHKQSIEHALTRWSNNARVWEKYRWLANYHNHFCHRHFSKRRDLLITHRATITGFRRFK